MSGGLRGANGAFRRIGRPKGHRFALAFRPGMVHTMRLSPAHAIAHLPGPDGPDARV